MARGWHNAGPRRRRFERGQRPSNAALPGPFSTNDVIPIRRSSVAKSAGELLALDRQAGVEVDLEALVDRLLGGAQRRTSRRVRNCPAHASASS